MKNLKSVLALTTLLLGITFFISCSNENDSQDQVAGKSVNTFLKTFYQKEFVLGNSVETRVVRQSTETSKEVEYEDLVISEVFVGGEERARGYVITDKNTSIFLYFVDVDRTESKMTKVDIEANDTQVLENIEQLDKYLATNEFDLIKVAQDLKEGLMIGDEDLANILSTSSSARIIRQFVHDFGNGCIGTHTYHSALFGLIKWETYEVIVCE